jgi:hypothetical protein
MKKIQIILVRGGLVLLGMLLWLAFHAMTQH